VWRAAAAEPGAEVLLADTALVKLAALRLVARSARGVEPAWVTPLPAIARYGVAAPTVSEGRGRKAARR
jgi:hypothetical protein